jgi:Uma2 family endonuclease
MTDEKSKDASSEEISEQEWLQAAANNKAFEFLANTEEDIYTLEDGISWEQFEQTIAAMGDKRSSRVTYDRGKLEIIEPAQAHAYYKELVGNLIKELADGMGKDYESCGSTLWKRQAEEVGIEPDNSFYFQNEGVVRGRMDVDLEKDPPPDLVLEIDLTPKMLDRMSIYARLGVPEVWRYSESFLRIYRLEAGKYTETEDSSIFEGFPVRQIPDFIRQNIMVGSRARRQAFKGWVDLCAAELDREDALDLQEAIEAEAAPENQSRIGWEQVKRELGLD